MGLPLGEIRRVGSHARVEFAPMTESKNKTAFQEVLAELKRGVEEMLLEEELRERLASNRSLRIKVGFDPTAPDLHLWHTVIINKMRQFQ